MTACFEGNQLDIEREATGAWLTTIRQIRDLDVSDSGCVGSDYRASVVIIRREVVRVGEKSEIIDARPGLHTVDCR